MFSPIKKEYTPLQATGLIKPHPSDNVESRPLNEANFEYKVEMSKVYNLKPG